MEPLEELKVPERVLKELAFERYLTESILTIGTGIIQVCYVKKGQEWVNTAEGRRETLNLLMVVCAAMEVTPRELEAAVMTLTIATTKED